MSEASNVPPQSPEAGDRIRVSIVDHPIGFDVADKLPSSSDGAVVVFVGTVRDSSEGKSVEQLDYESYDEMAEREMRELAKSALSRWKIGSVAIVHRKGSLGIGEIAVLVAVSAPHRDGAFEACRYLIDTLKQTVPIWKKEHFSDGSNRWVNHP